MHEFDESLITAYLDGELSRDDRLRVEQHLELHPEARCLLADFEKMRAMVRRLQAERLSSDIAGAVIDRATLIQNQEQEPTNPPTRAKGDGAEGERSMPASPQWVRPVSDMEATKSRIGRFAWSATILAGIAACLLLFFRMKQDDSVAVSMREDHFAAPSSSNLGRASSATSELRGSASSDEQAYVPEPAGLVFRETHSAEARDVEPAAPMSAAQFGTESSGTDRLGGTAPGGMFKQSQMSIEKERTQRSRSGYERGLKESQEELSQDLSQSEMEGFTQQITSDTPSQAETIDLRLMEATLAPRDGMNRRVRNDAMLRTYAFVPASAQKKQTEGGRGNSTLQGNGLKFPATLRSSPLQIGVDQITNSPGVLSIQKAELLVDSEKLTEPQFVLVEAMPDFEQVDRRFKSKDDLDSSERRSEDRRSSEASEALALEEGASGDRSADDSTSVPDSTEAALIVVSEGDLSSFRNWAEAHGVVPPESTLELGNNFGQFFEYWIPSSTPPIPESLLMTQKADQAVGRGSEPMVQEPSRIEPPPTNRDLDGKTNNDPSKGRSERKDAALNGSTMSNRPPRLEQPASLDTWYVFRVRVIRSGAKKE